MANITRRKELRRDIRRLLGTSSDAAPDTLQVLRAADAMKALLDLTSGQYGLAIVPLNQGDRQRADKDVPTMKIADALKSELAKREESQNERIARWNAELKRY